MRTVFVACPAARPVMLTVYLCDTDNIEWLPTPIRPALEPSSVTFMAIVSGVSPAPARGLRRNGFHAGNEGTVQRAMDKTRLTA
jgi:hypothetical protein